MKIEKIDHIAIRVKNLAKARKLFTEAFGCEFNSLGESAQLDIKSIMDTNGIELVEPLLPDGATSKMIDKYGEGLTLLSLKVSDLDEAVEHMKKMGVRIIAREQKGNMRMAILHPKDVFGVQIELIEYRGEHPAVTAIKGYASEE